MQRAIVAVVVTCACVAESGDTGRRPPAQGALAVQDSGAPFTGTLKPVRRSTSAPAGAAVLQAVHAGREPGFDRVVFEFSGPGLPGYQVQYATEPIRACGSGAPVSLDGADHLLVRFESAQAHDSMGHVTAADRALAPRLPEVLELKLVCDFEGQVAWAIGLAARRPFRVLEDSQPPRVIVDVRHRE
ncbi:MAG TPA: hypothetical protein VIV10_07875 [Gemmatimonadales bacterium]